MRERESGGLIFNDWAGQLVRFPHDQVFAYSL